MIAVQTPYTQFFATDGSPLDNGYLYIGLVSQNPETAPAQVFWDFAGTQPAAQPIRLLNGYPSRAGTPTPIFTPEDYSFTVKNARGSIEYTSSFSPSISTSASNLLINLAGAGANQGTGIVTHNPAANYLPGSAGLAIKNVVASAATAQTNALSAIGSVAYKSPSAIRQRIHANLFLQNNFGQGGVILGDSVNQGAYCTNAYTSSIATLLGRGFRAAFGGDKQSQCDSIGYMPMEAVYNSVASINTPQLHAVTFSAGWGALHPTNPAPYNYPMGNAADAAANIVNGKSYSSSTSGSSITIVFPTMAPSIELLVTQQPSGGVFGVTVNGVSGPNITTAGALLYNVQKGIAVQDNGKGSCTVILTKLDASPTEINAVIKYKNDSGSIIDLENRFSVANFSQGGRALQFMSESAIARACNCAVLFMMLGINDVFLGTDTDDAVFAAFRQRINWLIQYCKVYRNQVVVPDFCWYSPNTSRTRLELQRLAAETGGLYLPMPNNFYSDNIPPVVTAGTAGASPLNDPQYLWADQSHPVEKGHGLIFATIATAIGLPVTSRRQALEQYDWPFPLQITNPDVVNATPTLFETLSRITQQGKSLRVKLNVKHATLANFPLGNFQLTTGGLIPSIYRTGWGQNFVPLNLAIATNSVTGAAVGMMLTAGNGDITVLAVSASVLATARAVFYIE